jgi:hypothetical protein
LISIGIDKTSAAVGDSVNITLQATDNGGSGIKNVFVYYLSPITQKSRMIVMNNTGGDTYEGTISLTSADESGIWVVEEVYLCDYLDNRAHVSNVNLDRLYYTSRQDFSHVNFELSGTTADVTLPELISIGIDKTSVAVGENVKITLQATDNGGSGINRALVYYLSPITRKEKVIELSNVVGDTYEGTISLTGSDELGKWIVEQVNLRDNMNNEALICSSDLNYQGYTSYQDFSHVEFELKEISILPLPKKCVTQNESWTSNTIDGDLYIGPQAVLTVNGSVTVNGDVYILGAVKNYGNLTVTGTVHARQVLSEDSASPGSGTLLMLGGTNSIGLVVTSNDPIDIPLTLYEADNGRLVAFDGKISLTGATLPIADLYIDGSKVGCYSDGTFYLKLDTSSMQQVSFKTVDIFGCEKVSSYIILNKYYDTNADSTLNIVDLANVAKEYNTRESGTIWQGQYDYNCDGIIDIYDLVKLSVKLAN